MNVATPRAAQVDVWARRFARLVTRVVRVFSAHWLLVVNLFMALFWGLPFLAPVLMQAGYERPAALIYTLFRPLCHQLPERSFFLYGPQGVYSLDDLAQLLSGELVPLRYIGATEIGFKVAVCQRDVAIYLAMLLGGIAFSALRGVLKPLPFRLFVLLAVPMAVDGAGQLVGLWTSTWWSRLATGALFGLASVWLAYPHLDQGMREVHQELTKLATSEDGFR